MIAGIGVDIVEIDRVERLLDKYGERFARRILTDAELQTFTRRGSSHTFLASRFAAKEAVAKAFGTGIGDQLGFHSIQIEHDAAGKPLLRFVGAGQTLAESRGIANALLSISDEKRNVVAMVVLEAA